MFSKHGILTIRAIWSQVYEEIERWMKIGCYDSEAPKHSLFKKLRVYFTALEPEKLIPFQEMMNLDKY